MISGKKKKVKDNKEYRKRRAGKERNRIKNERK